MRALRRLTILLAPLLASLALQGPAEARTESASPYTKAQTYSGALRYLRVDLGYEITEQDPEAAYLLFRYVTPGQREPSPGSIEVIQTEERVKILVQLPKLPSYHEAVLRDGLLAKLRADYGEPPRKKAPAESEPRRPKRDGDDDSGPPGTGDKGSSGAKRGRNRAANGEPSEGER